MTESLTVSTVLNALPRDVFSAWIDSRAHSLFTNGAAVIDPVVGGDFSAWDGYITGKTLELHPFEKIVQSWRTTDFPPNSPDSHLTISFEEITGGTLITLNHVDIPEGQSAEYKQGWEDYYFSPMKEYFENRSTPDE